MDKIYFTSTCWKIYKSSVISVKSPIKPISLTQFVQCYLVPHALLKKFSRDCLRVWLINTILILKCTSSAHDNSCSEPHLLIYFSHNIIYKVSCYIEVKLLIVWYEIVVYRADVYLSQTGLGIISNLRLFSSFPWTLYRPYYTLKVSCRLFYLTRVPCKIILLCNSFQFHQC